MLTYGTLLLPPLSGRYLWVRNRVKQKLQKSLTYHLTASSLLLFGLGARRSSPRKFIQLFFSTNRIQPRSNPAIGFDSTSVYWYWPLLGILSLCGSCCLLTDGQKSGTTCEYLIHRFGFAGCLKHFLSSTP